MTATTIPQSNRHAGSYVFDQAWHHERQRLQSIEELFDPASRWHLEALGVADGWDCLEVGCGAGGVARWLADRVAPTGHVLGIDLDPRFLEGHGHANLEVRRQDVVHDALEPARFDLVHARAVLCHLPERDAVLSRLVNATRPGGWVMIEDVDFGGAAAAMAARYVVPGAQAAASERIYRAIEAAFAAIGADGCYGARLPAALIDAGMLDVQAEVHAPVIRRRSSGDWVTLSMEHLAPRMVAAGLLDEGEVDRFVQAVAEPSTRYMPPFMVTAWGRR
jgi:SAM-dependent methyltransferase